MWQKLQQFESNNNRMQDIGMIQISLNTYEIQKNIAI